MLATMTALPGTSLLGICLHGLICWAGALGWVYGVLAIGALLQARRIPSPFARLPACGPRPAPAGVWYWIAAHDEARVIGRTVRRIRRLDPGARCEVVADACSDATAHLAREAGARVHERAGTTGLGKGAALAWLRERLAADLGPQDLVIVLDADNVVRAGAPEAWRATWCLGYDVVQGVREAGSLEGASGPDGLAEAVHHGVMAPGLTWWGAGPTLSGSATAFTAATLERLLVETRTLVEDFEWQLALARDGVAVGWAPGARVLDGKTATGDDLVRQRTRWIRGKWRLAWSTLFRACLPGTGSLIARSRQLAWIALLPPRLWVGVGLGLGNLQTWWPGHGGPVERGLLGLGAAGFALHLMIGVRQLEQRLPGLSGLWGFAFDVVRATVLAIAWPGRERWVRTPRVLSASKKDVHRPRGGR
jgi:hypothetical protein